MTPAQHLHIWFTPERRNLINALGFDKAAERKHPMLSRFLKNEKYMTLERGGVAVYYPALRLIGYHPKLDLLQDESVQRYPELVALVKKLTGQPPTP